MTPTLDGPKAAIIVATDKLSGAQNRAIKIYRALRQSGYPIELWLTPGLRKVAAAHYPVEAAQAVEYHIGGPVHRLLRPLQRSRSLWRWMEASGLPAALGEPRFEQLATARDIKLAHVFLDLQMAHVHGVPTIFEITSPDIADQIGAWPRPRQRAHALYHAVSPSVARRFAASSPAIPMVEAAGPFFEARTRQDGAHKTNTIVFAHRFLPRKNAVLFAHVARRFVEARPGWHVEILGWGECEAQVRAAAGPSDNIVVRAVEDVPAVLATSRLFVSLIEPDNYPSQSVMEAMAAANALLVSDTGDSAAMFLDDNGTATSLDEDSVLHNLLQLTADDARLSQMGQRSQELAQERFSTQSYLRHLTNLYASVAACKNT